MANLDSRQFDGTLGNAKAICAWAGGPDKAVCGATHGFTDDMEGGLNLVSTVNDAPFYTDVPRGHWVVKSADGALTAFSDEQYKVAFPAA